MKIIGTGTGTVGTGMHPDEITPYSFEMDGRPIGIRTRKSGGSDVTIEVQDLTHTVYIHATFEEIERVYQWCKGDSSVISPR